jgi:hypothetical protein
LAGCGLLSVDVSQDIPAQTVIGSPIGALVPATLFALPLTIDLQSETAAHGTGPATSANLSSLTLSTTSPSGARFDFLTSIAISIGATSGGNLLEVIIAKLQPVQDRLHLDPSGPWRRSAPYIKAGASIQAAVSGHLPSSNTTIIGKVVVTVHV